jgi:hypothetical protein
MENTDSALVLRRVERLERENRRWRLAALLLLVGIGGVAAAQAGRTVTADKLILVDSQGNNRAVIAVSEKGALQTFMTSGGRPLLRMGLVGDEPRVETWDKDKGEWRNWVGPGGVFPVR